MAQPTRLPLKLSIPVRELRFARGERGRRSPEHEAIPDRLISLGVALTVVAVFVQTASHLANALFFEGRFRNLNAGAEGTAFTWASSVAAFGAALAALVLASILPERRRRFGLLAATIAFFSLDDIIELHEGLGWDLAVRVLGLPGYFGGRLFVVLYLPLFALTFALLWLATRDALVRVRRCVRLGLGLLVAAVAAELLATIWFARGATFGSWPDVFEVAFEEGAELAGWILIASGLIASICHSLILLGRREQLEST